MYRVENINRSILEETVSALGKDLEERFPKLPQWLNGQQYPTVNQLAELAKAVHVPFGYFFLNELPKKDHPIPHYRTLGQGSFKPSADLSETIKIVQERQQWAKDMLIEMGNDPLPFGGSVTPDQGIEKTAELLQELLGLRSNWAESQVSWSGALRHLVERTERAGIFVVINGCVGHNTKRPLDVKEFRGFVLYDEYAPFVFVNGKDAASARIFTLIHELVHVLLGKSASFDLRQMLPASDRTERYCDQVAAEFLVPQKTLKDLAINGNRDPQHLAKQFKVSPIVVARRLLDLELISKGQFFQFYDDYTQREFKKSDKPGGDFYNNAPYRVSRKFFDLVHSSVRQNKVLYSDAFRITGLKPKTFDGYLKKHT